MNKTKGMQLGAVALVIVALAYVGFRYDVQQTLKDALDWIRGLGPAGPLVFAAIYVVAAVVFLPGSVLTLGAGAIYGVAQGTLIVILSATLAATCAFLVGRYLARDWVAAKIQANRKFQAIDEAVAKEGWKIVGLTRLSPVFPYNLLNYAFGITKVSLRDFVLASLFGMLPGTLMFVYVGSLAGDLATLGAGERSRTTAELALYVVGLVATIVVTIFVTRLARAALDKRID